MKLCYVIIDGLAINCWETAVNSLNGGFINYINDNAFKVPTLADIFSVSRPGHVAFSYRLSPFETNLVGNRFVDIKQMKVVNPPLDLFKKYRSVFDDLKDAGETLLGFGNKGCGISEGGISKETVDPGDEGGQRTLQLYMRMTKDNGSLSTSYSPFHQIAIPSGIYHNGKREPFDELNERRKKIRERVFGGEHVGVDKFGEMDDVLIEKVVELINMYNPSVITGTIGGPDKAIHTDGTKSLKAADILKNSIEKVRELLFAMGDDTLFILTTDHGNSDTPHIFPISSTIHELAKRMGFTENDYTIATDGRRGFRIWFNEDVMLTRSQQIYELVDRLKKMKANRWVHFTPEFEEVESIFDKDVGYDRDKFGHVIGTANEEYGYDITYRKANHGGVTSGCTKVFTFFAHFNGRKLTKPSGIKKILQKYLDHNKLNIWDISAVALEATGAELSNYETPKIRVADFFENK